MSVPSSNTSMIYVALTCSTINIDMLVHVEISKILCSGDSSFGRNHNVVENGTRGSFGYTFLEIKRTIYLKHIKIYQHKQ